MSPLLRLAALFVLILGLVAEAADRAPVSPITSRFEKLATIEVPVEEISGLSVLPGATKKQVDLLVVTDEGPYDREKHEVRGALYVIRLHFAEDSVRSDAPTPVTLKVRFERFDPKWPKPVSPMDLEALAPLRGTGDLYVITGERNPEDQTDDGANRVYVVQYPSGDEKTARVLHYFRLFDLPFDGMNDRFEGCATSLLHTGPEGTRWRLYGFKERTPVAEQVPGYAWGELEKKGDAFTLKLAGDRGYPPLLPSAYTTDPSVVSQQSDACQRADLSIWVLDRWRRQIHVTKPGADGALALREHLDLWTVVKDIPGEVNASRPPPPGLPERKGYGRHEALGFDPQGRLYLGTDRGGGTPSTLTVLVPRPGIERGATPSR